MNEALVSASRGLLLRCRVPEGRRERLRGLIGLGGLASDGAFLIANATSVHTFGVRFPILVARLDASFRVVDVRVVRPWRFVPAIRRARHVLECHEGADVRVGDELVVVRVADGSGGRRAQPASARTKARTSVEPTVSVPTTIGRKRRDHAGSATGSRRAPSGSTIPRNSSRNRIGKSSARAARS